MPTPLLDYGTGQGVLLAELRRRGIDAVAPGCSSSCFWSARTSCVTEGVGVDAISSRDLCGSVVDDLVLLVTTWRWVDDLADRLGDQWLGAREHFGASPECGFFNGLLFG